MKELIQKKRWAELRAYCLDKCIAGQYEEVIDDLVREVDRLSPEEKKPMSDVVDKIAEASMVPADILYGKFPVVCGVDKSSGSDGTTYVAGYKEGDAFKLTHVGLVNTPPSEECRIHNPDEFEYKLRECKYDPVPDPDLEEIKAQFSQPVFSIPVGVESATFRYVEDHEIEKALEVMSAPERSVSSSDTYADEQFERRKPCGSFAKEVEKKNSLIPPLGEFHSEPFGEVIGSRVKENGELEVDVKISQPVKMINCEATIDTREEQHSKRLDEEVKRGEKSANPIINALMGIETVVHADAKTEGFNSLRVTVHAVSTERIEEIGAAIYDNRPAQLQSVGEYQAMFTSMDGLIQAERFDLVLTNPL